MRINENKLARHVALREGLRQSVSIAQVKEVLRHALDILASDYPPSAVLALLERHQARKE